MTPEGRITRVLYCDYDVINSGEGAAAGVLQVVVVDDGGTLWHEANENTVTRRNNPGKIAFFGHPTN